MVGRVGGDVRKWAGLSVRWAAVTLGGGRAWVRRVGGDAMRWVGVGGKSGWGREKMGSEVGGGNIKR